MAGFGKSFDEAFKPAQASGAAAALEAIKQKIKTNDEQRQSSAIFDVIHQKVIADAAKNGAHPEQLDDLSKKIDKMSKIGFSPTEALGIGKMIAPDVFQSEEAMAIKQGNLEQRKLHEQDQLEKTAGDRVAKIFSNRSGGLGLQDAKVNSAFHALSVLDQGFDQKTGQINVPAYLQAELAANIANTISNQSVTADAMRQDLMSRNIYGDFNKTLQYITGSPQNALPQDIFKSMLDTVVRQGNVSQKLRDNYIKQSKDLLPSNLEADRKQRILDVNLGNDFTASLKDSPVYNHFFGEGASKQTTPSTQSSQSSITPEMARAELERRRKAKS